MEFRGLGRDGAETERVCAYEFAWGCSDALDHVGDGQRLGNGVFVESVGSKFVFGLPLSCAHTNGLGMMGQVAEASVEA